MYKKIKKLIFQYIPAVVKTGVLAGIPRLYGLLEIKPRSCTVLITNRCNLKCIMCKQWTRPAGKELGIDDWRQIFRDLRKNGIRNLHFSGGEPLLRSDITELVGCARQNGFVPGMTTNGLLLKEGLLQELVDAGLKSVAISIDGLNQEYERIRAIPHSFIRVKEAAAAIARMRKKAGIDAYINFTLMKDNMNQLQAVKGFADEIDLPLAVCLLDKHSHIFELEDNRRRFWINEDEDFRRLKLLTDLLKREKRRAPQTLLLNFPMIEFIAEYFRDPCQADIPCVSSQDRIIIDSSGNLLGGCLAMGSFGNIRQTPFARLRREERYRQAKRNMFYKRCPGCSCGYQFNIRCFPRLMLKDLGQRISYWVNKE